jgi:hypothetical protein
MYHTSSYIISYHIMYLLLLLFPGRNSQLGPGRPIVETARSCIQLNTHARTHARARAVGILWKNESPDTETGTYTTQNEHKRWISMHSAVFEPRIPAIERLQTFALDRKANGIANSDLYRHDSHINLLKIRSIALNLLNLNAWTSLVAWW